MANKATHKTEACSLSGSSGDADIKSRSGDTMGEGVSGRNRENGMETFTLPCVKQMAGGNALCDSGSSTQSSVGTARGGMGSEVGGGSKREGHTCLWVFMLMYGRSQHTIEKQVSSNKKFDQKNPEAIL